MANTVRGAKVGVLQLGVNMLTMLRAALSLLKAFPAALEREYLRWALEEIHPLHPDVPHIVMRINELESLCKPR